MADLSLDAAAMPMVLIGASTLGVPTTPAAVDLNGGLIVAGEGTAGNPSGGVLSIQGVTGGALLATKDGWAAAGDDGKMFTFTTMSVTLSSTVTTEQALFLIDNPAGSGKSVKIKFWKLGTPVGTGNTLTFTTYRAPTITANGTVLAGDGGRTLGQNTKVANYYKLPTWTAGTGVGHAYHKTAGNTPELILDKGFALIIDPGNKFLLTVTPSATALTTYVTLDVKEE